MAGLSRAQLITLGAGSLVIATIGLADFPRLLGGYRVSAAAREFESQLHRVRLMGHARGVEAAVLLEDAGQGGWRLALGERPAGSRSWDVLPLGPDEGPDGIFDLGTGPHRRPQVEISQWSPVAGPAGYNLPDALVFSPVGRLQNAPSDTAEEGISVVFTDLPSGLQRIVRINADAHTVILTGEP